MRVAWKCWENFPNFGYILKLEYCLSSVGLIHMRANSFLQLQFLKLHEGEIERWTQDEGVMPGQRQLVIHECFDLTMLPSELRSLTALREVQVLRSNLHLANEFQRLQMELGFELLIYPPLHTDFYVNPSGNCHKWRYIYILSFLSLLYYENNCISMDSLIRTGHTIKSL
jgi:hypothetical protein